MIPFGVTRRVDSIGRIIIPIELRREHGLKYRTEMELFIYEDVLYVTKYYPKCVFCGNKHDTIEYENKTICNECVKELKEL